MVDHSPDPTGWERIKNFLDSYTGMIGIVALVIYAVVRVATDAFYTRLNLTPEAVGLSQTLILGRAALYTAVFVILAFSCASLWYLIFGSVGLGLVKIKQRWHPAVKALKHPSHTVLLGLFFLMFGLPFVLDTVAPYFVAFIFHSGDRLVPFVFAWVLLLLGALYWASRLVGFKNAGALTQTCLALAALLLTLPLPFSYYLFPGTGHRKDQCGLTPAVAVRPYRSWTGPLSRNWCRLQHFQRSVDFRTSDNFAHASGSLRLTLLAWSALVFVLVAIAWSRRRCGLTVTSVRADDPVQMQLPFDHFGERRWAASPPAVSTSMEDHSASVPASSTTSSMEERTGQRDDERFDLKAEVGNLKWAVPILVVVVGVSILLAFKDGNGYADGITSGYGTTPGRFSAFNFEAEAACMASTTNQPVFTSPVLLLGVAQNTITVIAFPNGIVSDPNRPEEFEVVKMPATGIVMKLLHDDLAPKSKYDDAAKACDTFRERVKNSVAMTTTSAVTSHSP